MRFSRLFHGAPAVLLLASTRAFAGDVATAEALFDKGVAEMNTEHFDVACPAIDESQRLDPKAGTVFTQATCYARWGKLATAVALYSDYLGLFEGMDLDKKKQHNDRMRIAKAQQSELEPQRPMLTLVLPKDSPKEATVERDGTMLEAPSMGVALPVDPGEHVIVVEAPGRQIHRQTVVLAKGDKTTLELSLGPPVVVTPPETKPRAETLKHSENEMVRVPLGTLSRDGATTGTDWSRSRRFALYGAGGVGVAGLVVGFVGGGLAIAERDTVVAHCDGAACDHEGKVAADTLKRNAMVSNVGFGVGIAGAAAAVILWVTGPTWKKVEPSKVHAGVLRVDGNGIVMGVKGAF